MLTVASGRRAIAVKKADPALFNELKNGKMTVGAAEKVRAERPPPIPRKTTFAPSLFFPRPSQKLLRGLVAGVLSKPARLCGVAPAHQMTRRRAGVLDALAA